MAHSPAPWTLAPACVVVAADGRRVCNVSVRLDPSDVDDAHLITAAPDYAKAAPDAAYLLERYADFIRRDVKVDDLERHPYLPLIEQTATDLRAAIARATGAGA